MIHVNDSFGSPLPKTCGNHYPLISVLILFLAVSVSSAETNIASSNSAMAMGLFFSTFFGGSQFERAQGVAVDKDGFIYIAGNTSSSLAAGCSLDAPFSLRRMCQRRPTLESGVLKRKR